MGAPAAAPASRRWELLADPAHKRSTPVLYHVEEVLEIWKQISAPVLWVEGDQTDIGRWWGKRYTKAEFHERLKVVPRSRSTCSRRPATCCTTTSRSSSRPASMPFWMGDVGATSRMRKSRPFPQI